MKTPEQEPGEMHWKDGWMFKRLEDGSVRIRAAFGEITIDNVAQPITVTATIPPAEWVSLIHHLGAVQTTEAFWEAERFHRGAPTRTTA